MRELALSEVGMNPANSTLTIVTASIDPERTRDFWGTWLPLCALEGTRVICVVNSPEQVRCPPHEKITWTFVTPKGVLGPVGAFAAGIRIAAEQGATLLACLHDDVALLDYGWDKRVVEHFAAHPACSLAGFSGAEGLGAPDIYQGREEPTREELSQLARQGFFSNMVDAEKHGRRELRARVSACADGFSQIGRTPFLQAAFNHFKVRGVKHHSYDSWLGMLAWKWGGECWYLPERCAHAGGRTAVLAEEYHAWAKKLGGDEGIWRHAHEQFWEDGKGFLPFRVGEP